MIDAHSKRLATPAKAALIVATLMLCLTACAPSEPTPAPLVPSIRLLGSRFTTGGGPGVDRHGYVTINGVIRPTFSSSHRFPFFPSCVAVETEPPPGGGETVAPAPVETDTGPELVDCTLLPPKRIPRTSWVVLEAPLAPSREPSSTPGPGRRRTAREHLRIVTPGLASGAPVGRIARTVRIPKDAVLGFGARVMPRLPQRNVVTPVMTLPGGGVLRTYIGVEEPAWGEESAPLVFTVTALREGAKPDRLFRRLVDPAKRERDRDWIPVEIPLPDRGDEPFRLAFEARPRKKRDVRPSLPVWGDPTILQTERKRRAPRHVVLISLDTLRSRSMSAYGYELPTTPLFEEMLASGTLFENAFTTFSNTLGSHMSMMTGLYPATHRVGGTNLHLDDSVPTLAQRLRDAGYETAAFTEDALLSAAAGFQRGFARYFENKDVYDGAGDAEGTFRRALDWARRQPDEPLFLFVHTYEVHAPYLPPEYTRKELTSAPEPRTQAGTQRRAYEREILHLDHLLADFVAELGRLGAPGDLLLVITADHGEEFMEHGSVAHLQLFDEVMQVPMFLRWPGHIPAGKRIATPVSLVDVVPTVLELVGAKPMPGDGVSLVPLLEDAAFEREVVFAQSAPGKRNDMKSRYIARSRDAKCMVRDVDQGWVECFDLVADPDEKKPLVPDTSPRLSKLHDQAVDYRARATREVEGKEAAEGLAAGVEADPARREKLRVLGYIE